LIELITDPEVHPPISLIDGTLNHQQSPEMALLKQSYPSRVT